MHLRPPAAVLATPTSGAIAWIDSRTFLTPETVAGAFAVCGLVKAQGLTRAQDPEA